MINSWQNKTLLQQPDWINKKQLKTILEQIRNYPKLVSKDEIDVLKNHLERAQINSNDILTLSQTDEIKQQLIINTERAVNRGVFGAPSIFVGEELYFGQDRLFFVEKALK